MENVIINNRQSITEIYRSSITDSMINYQENREINLSADYLARTFKIAEDGFNALNQVPSSNSLMRNTTTDIVSLTDANINNMTMTRNGGVEVATSPTKEVMDVQPFTSLKI